MQPRLTTKFEVQVSTAGIHYRLEVVHPELVYWGPEDTYKLHKHMTKFRCYLWPCWDFLYLGDRVWKSPRSIRRWISLVYMYMLWTAYAAYSHISLALKDSGEVYILSVSRVWSMYLFIHFVRKRTDQNTRGPCITSQFSPLSIYCRRGNKHPHTEDNILN